MRRGARGGAAYTPVDRQAAAGTQRAGAHAAASAHFMLFFFHPAAKRLPARPPASHDERAAQDAKPHEAKQDAKDDPKGAREHCTTKGSPQAGGFTITSTLSAAAGRPARLTSTASPPLHAPEMRNRNRNVTAPSGVSKKSRMRRPHCGQGWLGAGNIEAAAHSRNLQQQHGSQACPSRAHTPLPACTNHAGGCAAPPRPVPRPHQRRAALQVAPQNAAPAAELELAVRIFRRLVDFAGGLCRGACCLGRLAAHIKLSVHLQWVGGWAAWQQNVNGGLYMQQAKCQQGRQAWHEAAVGVLPLKVPAQPPRQACWIAVATQPPAPASPDRASMQMVSGKQFMRQCLLHHSRRHVCTAPFSPSCPPRPPPAWRPGWPPAARRPAAP